MDHPDRKIFDREVLSFLRGRGFTQDADVLYGKWVDFGVETEFAETLDVTDDDMVDYLRQALSDD